MINGIGSSNGYQNYLQPQSMRERSPDAAGMFKKLDTDGDGKLSQTELDTWSSEMSQKTGQTISTDKAISTYDTDGDGGLSSEEMQAFVSSTMQQGMGCMGMQGQGATSGSEGLFSALDSDGSGGVSESELSTWAANMEAETGQTTDTTDAITTYDTDGDGELSGSELKSFMDASGIQPPPPPGMGMGAGPGQGDLFQALDSDGSGGVSESELSTWAANMGAETGQSIDISEALSTYDTDSSGELNATELKSFLDASGVKPPEATASSDTSTSTSSSSASGIFSKYDTNGDGVLSATELQAYLDDQNSTYQSFVQKALALYQSLMDGSSGSSSLDYSA